MSINRHWIRLISGRSRPDPLARSVTSIERRSAADKNRAATNIEFHRPIIVNIAQAFRFAGCCCSAGWLAKSGVDGVLHGLRLGWGTFTGDSITGSLVTAVCLSRVDAYMLSSFRSPGQNTSSVLLIPLLAGGGSTIVCLFLMHDDDRAFREWPFPLDTLRAPYC